jgi:hydroxyacylglutathione hydrolase
MRIERLRLDGSNAYLIRGEQSVLVDSGPAHAREQLVKQLSSLGVSPGTLSLVLLTHVDARTAGNADFLKRQFRAPIAVHSADAPILASGVARRPRVISPLGLIAGLFEAKRFLSVTPDLVFGHTLDLRLYGVAAVTVHTPGATIGSSTVLLSTGDAMVGDLVAGGFLGGGILPHRPALPTLAESPERIAHAVALLERLGARRVHPAQGRELRMADVRALVSRIAPAEAIGPSSVRVRERRLAQQMAVRA